MFLPVYLGELVFPWQTRKEGQNKKKKTIKYLNFFVPRVRDAFVYGSIWTHLNEAYNLKWTHLNRAYGDVWSHLRFTLNMSQLGFLSWVFLMYHCYYSRKARVCSMLVFIPYSLLNCFKKPTEPQKSCQRIYSFKESLLLT